MNVFPSDKGFIETILKKLRDCPIKYCIIGDYLGLPDSIGHDIDFWTSDIRSFRNILFQAIKETGHKILIDNHTANGCNVVFFKREGDAIYLMKADVMCDTSYKSSLTLVNKKVMAENIVPFKDFYVASPESEAVMHFLHPMFEWGMIKKDKYKEDILRYYRSKVFYQSFESLWGKETTTELLSMIEKSDWEGIRQQMARLKRKALLRGVFKSCTYKNILRTTCYALKRKIKPSGKMLVFCGLDGAGKTTIWDELNGMFVNLLKNKKVYYGYWRPYVLPEIRELFGQRNSKDRIDKGTTEWAAAPPAKRTRGAVASFVKLCYYWADYLLAPIKYGGIHERGGMVLFDRHFIDMIVHPQRFEMKLPKWVLLFMYRFIPKADFTFFLYCTPEEIVKRKTEFTTEEIAAMTAEYQRIGKRIKNFIPIHTNTTIAEEIDGILSCIAIK